MFESGFDRFSNGGVFGYGHSSTYTPPPIVSPGERLTEDGGYRLLEDGGYRELEG